MLDLIEFNLVMFAVIFLAIGALIVLVLQEWWPNPQAYCVKERAKKEMTSAHTVVFRNGRKALKGRCSSCGTTLFRIEQRRTSILKSSWNMAVVTARKWGTMLGARLEEAIHPQAYCMKERARREITGVHTIILRNGRKALTGKCNSCGTTLFRIK